MISFIDENGYNVVLRFDAGPFEVEPRHVLAVVRHKGKWLCAVHKHRGVEFPGGKQEADESLMEAAIREVYEETQVRICDVKWLAYYVVHMEQPFCKAVYIAQVEAIEPFVGEYETTSRLWLTTEELMTHPNLSFYMRDEGMKRIVQEANRHEK